MRWRILVRKERNTCMRKYKEDTIEQAVGGRDGVRLGPGK